ncbi:hypothetical protein ROZALSC1DRAFT_20342 [Rozella allomycis CSF55]|uniref:Biotin-protein ligase N-terminal domain-containing protein n=1 Tax=Rozella allomycis (strain CSF55) TaxID=988480 RepID=A0A4P9YRF9_ROZAC|nr:hypothetical protein ROZALSC1DRAFT_20342 [Rozella allomycis CSF55]
MNVLVYDDFGVSTNSLKHTLYSLKKYLSQKYDVHTVNAKQLCDEPWQDNCACLVIPGGEDKFYQSKLHPVATEKIRNYVFQGGRYFGVCAGAYFASDQIEFERDTSNSVIGERNLKFFKGKAIGCLNEGFEYKKESGMMQALVSSPLGHHFYAYYNGGCYFSPWQDLVSSSVNISREICLALFFNTFEELYYEMITTGFPFKLYESYWLHSNQQVTLNEFNQDKFFIKGIDKDGFLICEKIGGLLEVLPGWKNETVLLGPDGNSFDMMKGLIKRK